MARLSTLEQTYHLVRYRASPQEVEGEWNPINLIIKNGVTYDPGRWYIICQSGNEPDGEAQHRLDCECCYYRFESFIPHNMSLNKYLFHGTIGGDAEVRVLDNGNSVISFSVAISEKWTDKSGEKKEKTHWVKCNKWVSVGGSTKIADYLKKGQQVIIEGVPSASAFKDKEGNAKASLEVKVNELTFAGSGKKSDSGGSEPSYQHTSPQEPAFDGTATDDLPF